MELKWWIVNSQLLKGHWGQFCDLEKTEILF